MPVGRSALSAVEVEVLWRTLLEPETVMVGRVLEELGRFLENVLGRLGDESCVAELGVEAGDFLFGFFQLLLQPGALFHGHFMARITFVSQTKDGDAERCRVEAQIEDLFPQSDVGAGSKPAGLRNPDGQLPQIPGYQVESILGRCLAFDPAGPREPSSTNATTKGLRSVNPAGL